MNGHPPLRSLYYGELTYIYYTNITLFPLLLSQINLKDRVEGRERERMRGVRWEEERGSIDSLIPVPLPVSTVSRSPTRKNKSQGSSDGCGTPGSSGFAIWMANTCISLMHSKLNLHLDGFPGPQPAQMHQKQPSTTTPLMGLIYHLQVYYVKMMLVRVQNVKMIL